MNTIEIISSRAIQRESKSLIGRVKRTKEPLFIGSKGKVEVVVMDSKEYHKLTTRLKFSDIEKADMLKRLEEIRNKGKQGITRNSQLNGKT